MVDWMLEVFGNYRSTTNNFTFFRAVSILDLYLKSTQKVYQDQDLHLIGIGAMLLASKLEDIYHIPLYDMVRRVSHNKFTGNQIKFIENEMAQTLHYDIYYSTTLNYLSHFFFRCFSISDNVQLINIYDTAIYVLKMILHDYDMMQFLPYIQAASALCYSVCEYFNTKKDEGYAESVIQQAQEKAVKSLSSICNVSSARLDECVQKVQKLVDSFQRIFPDLQNLAKFG